MDQYQTQQVNHGGYPPQQGFHQEVAPVVSVKEWLLTSLIMLIPIVNIIMAFVYAFGDGNPSKKNYFKANLIFAAIIIGIYLLILILFFGIFASMLGNSY